MSETTTRRLRPRPTSSEVEPAAPAAEQDGIAMILAKLDGLQDQVNSLTRKNAELGEKLAKLEVQSLRPIPGYDRIVTQVQEIASSVDLTPAVQSRLRAEIERAIVNDTDQTTADWIRGIARDHARTITAEQIGHFVATRVGQESTYANNLARYVAAHINANAEGIVMQKIQEILGTSLGHNLQERLTSALEERMSRRDGTFMASMARSGVFRDAALQAAETFLSARTWNITRA